MKKKLLVIVLALAMTLVFAACNSGSGSGAAAAEPAEPNAGVAGIVFAVPDGWTQGNITPGSYSEFTNPDSEYTLVTSAFGDKELEESNEWSEGDPIGSVQDYYDQYYTADEEELKKNNVEHSVIKVCDTDASYNKYTGGKDGYMEVGSYWMYDNTIYSMFLFNPSAYDDQGNVIEGAATLSDDEIKMFEDILASVQPGDGTAFQNEALGVSATSLGDIAFDAPAGYTVSEARESYVEFKKDGSDITLQISKTTEDDLQYIELEDGSHPTSLDAYYNQYERDSEFAASIAGYDGYIYKYPYEDDIYYDANAEFMTEDAIYSIYLGSYDIWDENGEVKPDAEKLSEDDLAAFDAFIASLRKK